MTLYYEDVPADDNDTPQLPPLLTAVAVPANQDVHAKAIALAASSEVGTVFYSETADMMHIAVVLGPKNNSDMHHISCFRIEYCPNF